MNCTEAEERILEALEGPLGAAARSALEAHLAGCAACRGFRDSQSALDGILAQHFVPPMPGPGFDARVVRAIPAEGGSELWELAPDLLHLAGGVVVTLAAAFALPFDRGAVLAAGGAATALSYVFYSWARTWLTDLDERAS